MAVGPTVQPLVSLGFTALEAEVYGFLLGESPVTGYRIAQALRKPAPNIYKAIESLEAKGAVMVDDGASRLCRPIPPQELLGHLERRFQEDRNRAAESLSEMTAPATDDRVYQLKSPDQVLERARRMLEQCREVALVDAFPRPLAKLRDDIEAAARRGVVVGVKAYSEIELAGARVIVDVRRESVVGRWPGQWVNVVVDGAEHLVAFLTEDASEVHQAIWSGSVYLSWVYHSALSAELALDAVQTELARDDATPDGLRALLAELRSLKALEATGYQRLVGQFARKPAPPDSVSHRTGAARRNSVRRRS
jgi:sugar-specific transcriptional regulator TrmB